MPTEPINKKNEIILIRNIIEAWYGWLVKWTILKHDILCRMGCFLIVLVTVSGRNEEVICWDYGHNDLHDFCISKPSYKFECIQVKDTT